MASRARWNVALGPRLVAWLVLVVALIVAPLRLAVAAPEPCCCPRPADCRCPDHQRDHGDTSIRPCTSPVEQVAPIPAPVMATPAPIMIVRPAPEAVAIVTTLPAPHPSPDLPRARGPS